jgi:hypothetical protein
MIHTGGDCGLSDTGTLRLPDKGSFFWLAVMQGSYVRTDLWLQGHARRVRVRPGFVSKCPLEIQIEF